MNDIIVVVGLGYVGLPLAIELDKKYKVIGFDINENKVASLINNIDPNDEIPNEVLEKTNIEYTSTVSAVEYLIKEKSVTYIVAVPTPIDSESLPNLKPLIGATQIVGSILKRGDYVIYESTVYPGCTEEECVPILEKQSNLKYIDDFKVGYSPERINPGDKVNTISTIMKVVSGCDEESLKNIAKLYGNIVTAGVFEAKSIKVAEASKVFENIQRDINIALVNELSFIMTEMGISTYDVLDAAKTKWNFLPFTPGLVGGHCISVDPNYLKYKANEIGINTQVIQSGRFVNEAVGPFVAYNVIKELSPNDSVLILGGTFKENVSDFRNTKVIETIKGILNYDIDVDLVDPNINSDMFKEEYGIEVLNSVMGSNKKYDAVIIAVPHKVFTKEMVLNNLTPNGLIYDLKGVFRDSLSHLNYKTL